MHIANTETVQALTLPATLDAPVRIKLTESLALQRIHCALREHFTRVWPTRRVALCPPARAALVDSSTFDIDALRTACNTKQALVVCLPNDFIRHLPTLARSPALIRIHPDTSLTRQRAYLSWSCPCQAGQLPLTLWIELEAVFDTLISHLVDTGRPTLPVVFVAGFDAVVGHIERPTRAAFDQALATANLPIKAPTERERLKALEKAAAYSEQPWLFMRYELRNDNQRLAVNWAPVLRIQSDASGIRCNDGVS